MGEDRVGRELKRGRQGDKKIRGGGWQIKEEGAAENRARVREEETE